MLFERIDDSRYAQGKIHQPWSAQMPNESEENQPIYRGLDDWITIAEAAQIMKVSENTVRYHCRKKNIESRKFGETNIWQVNKYDAEEFHRRAKSKNE